MEWVCIMQELQEAKRRMIEQGLWYAVEQSASIHG